MAADTETFHPQDTLANTAKSTIQTTLAGTIFAGAQNTLRKQNVGAMGIITKSGGIIGVFGMQLSWQTWPGRGMVTLIDRQPAEAPHISSPATLPPIFEA